MPGATPPRKRPWKGFPALAVLPLAFQQLRRTWFLLLFIALGLTAAVVIACTIPMLSNVLTTAGLRSTLRATPQSADITLDVETNGLSTAIVQNLHHQLDPIFPRYLGNAIKPDQFLITSQDFSLMPTRQNTALDVYGIPMQQAGSHLDLLQGQLPQITSKPAREIEVMMTPDTAKLLRVRVGSTLRLSLQYAAWISGTAFQHMNVISAHVVGLFQVTAANAGYWHGQDFKTNTATARIATTFSQYSLLMPDNALLALYDHFRALYQVDALHSLPPNGYRFTWYYHIEGISHSETQNHSRLRPWAR
jgi:hypothetical protein